MRDRIIKTFSVRMKAYLTVRRLSYRELAERSGVSKGTIMRMMNGVGNPNAEHAFSVARALECEVADLVR